ncbi:MAG: hypothetical protein PHF60_03165 [Candidatus ainarchaeum sp.]|nr:hypothetical protein [Candidatus ainarchaeum sp.]
MILRRGVGPDVRRYEQNVRKFPAFHVEVELAALGIAAAMALAGCQNPVHEENRSAQMDTQVPRPVVISSPPTEQQSLKELVKSLETGDPLKTKGAVLWQIADMIKNGQALGEYKHGLIKVLETPRPVDEKAEYAFRFIQDHAIAALYHASMNGENVREAAPALARVGVEGRISPNSHGYIAHMLNQIATDGANIDSAVKILADTVDMAADAEKAYNRPKTDTHMGIMELMEVQHRRSLALWLLRGITENGGYVDEAVPVLEKHRGSFNAKTGDEIAGILARQYLNNGDTKELMKMLKTNPSMEVINVFFDADAKQRAEAVAVLHPMLKKWPANGIYWNGAIELLTFYLVETHEWNKINDMLASPWTETAAKDGLQKASYKGYKDEVANFMSRQK